ncbi:MAG: ArnT family glycosyltransferase [Thermodesulfobacteriota bacterium]
MAGISERLKTSLAAAALLALFLALSVNIAVKKSNTWDEPAHLLAGYAHLTEGMDYLSPLHHPVVGRSIAAIFPALLLDLELDKGVRPEGAPGSDFFPYSLRFMFENGVDGRRVLFLARLGNICLGLLLGVYLFLWSSELWGARGGLLSLFFYALSPNVLAASSLATTDLPVTAFFFISLYYLYRTVARGPAPARSVAAGLFAALALGSKHTALLLLPALAVSFALSLRAARGPVGRGGGSGRVVSAYGAMVAVSFVVLWAVYGFRFHSGAAGYVPPDWSALEGDAFSGLFAFMRSLKVLPEAYLYSLAGSLHGAASGRAAFLMGARSTTGWWYYFPLAFLIKTPVATLFLLLSASGYLFARQREHLARALFLMVPAAAVFVLVSSQNVDIGLRHLLPAYPFIFALIGFVPLIRTESGRAARAVFAAASAWYVLAAAAIHPDQLAYFNEFVGGPRNGHLFLVDSNLDWGQDLTGLKDYMDERGIGRIKLAYFGFTDPAYYGIDYEYLPSYWIPRPARGGGGGGDNIDPRGWYAISATLLEGVYLQDPDLYAAFRETEPVETIGYSIFVYRLQPLS